MDRKLFFTAFTFLALVSCEKFLDGTINYVEFPDHESQISANLIVSDVANEIKAYVSKTVSVTDSLGPQVIENAVISVKDAAGNTLYTLSNEDFFGEFYSLPLSEGLNIPEGDIHLEVDVPEYDIATATTRMPSGAIFELEFLEAADTSNMFGQEYVRDRYEFDFENNVNEDQSYLVFIEAKYQDKDTGEISDWESLWAESTLDSRMQYLYGGILLTDESVRSDPNGLNDIYLFTENKEEYITIVERRIRIESLSDELKKFYVSLQEYSDNQFSLFTEPDLIYSNVNTGFGCFGMYRYELIEL